MQGIFKIKPMKKRENAVLGNYNESLEIYTKSLRLITQIVSSQKYENNEKNNNLSMIKEYKSLYSILTNEIQAVSTSLDLAKEFLVFIKKII